MCYGAQIAESFHHYGPDYGFTVQMFNLISQNFVKIIEAYIDRARPSYDGSFKRNGADLIEGRAHFR